jgi:hypothetical protein
MYSILHDGQGAEELSTLCLEGGRHDLERRVLPRIQLVPEVLLSRSSARAIECYPHQYIASQYPSYGRHSGYRHVHK